MWGGGQAEVVHRRYVEAVAPARLTLATLARNRPDDGTQIIIGSSRRAIRRRVEHRL
jgi:hypothetical protein